MDLTLFFSGIHKKVEEPTEGICRRMLVSGSCVWAFIGLYSLSLVDVCFPSATFAEREVPLLLLYFFSSVRRLFARSLFVSLFHL